MNQNIRKVKIRVYSTEGVVVTGLYSFIQSFPLKNHQIDILLEKGTLSLDKKKLIKVKKYPFFSIRQVFNIFSTKGTPVPGVYCHDCDTDKEMRLREAKKIERERFNVSDVIQCPNCGAIRKKS